MARLRSLPASNFFFRARSRQAQMDHHHGSRKVSPAPSIKWGFRGWIRAFTQNRGGHGVPVMSSSPENENGMSGGTYRNFSIPMPFLSGGFDSGVLVVICALNGPKSETSGPTFSKVRLTLERNSNWDSSGARGCLREKLSPGVVLRLICGFVVQ